MRGLGCRWHMRGIAPAAVQGPLERLRGLRGPGGVLGDDRQQHGRVAGHVFFERIRQCLSVAAPPPTLRVPGALRAVSILAAATTTAATARAILIFPPFQLAAVVAVCEQQAPPQQGVDRIHGNS